MFEVMWICRRKPTGRTTSISRSSLVTAGMVCALVQGEGKEEGKQIRLYILPRGIPTTQHGTGCVF